MLPAAPLYRPDAAIFHIRLFHHEIPIMLMTYLGALKTWLLAPIVAIFGPGTLTLRLLPVIVGSLTIWVFFHLLSEIHSRTAAWIGTALLATDTMFLLTHCFDWGPVALQQFLAVAGILLVVRYRRHERIVDLAGAGFLFGLALWDKALFIWLFSGLVVAVVVVFPQQVWRAIQQRRGQKALAVASLSLVAGASPLIFYNFQNQFATSHATSGFSTRDVYAKSFVLRGTWDGSGLFGYVVNADSAPRPRQAADPIETASFRLHSLMGDQQRNGLVWGLLASLLCIPLAWRRPAFRIALFTIVAMAIAWFQMAITNGAGGSVHHVILLWPLPHMFIAVLFAEVALRFVKTARFVFQAGTFVLIVWNLLVTNQYLYQFARDGAAGSWTDATYSLCDGLGKNTPPYLAIIDWGLIEPLDFLQKGRLPLFWAGDPFVQRPAGEPVPKPDDRLLQDPATLWVGHTDGYEEFTGVNKAVDEFCRREGYKKIPVGYFYDRNGRSIFQTFHLQSTKKSWK